MDIFHGTNVDIEGAIRPSTATGKSVWGDTGHSGQKSSEHAFATTDENVAWNFARHAYSRKYGEGRSRVYEVAPNPMMRPGVFNSKHPRYMDGSGDLSEYVSPSFRITGQRDIMPGRQGTFPNLNWNQFKESEPMMGALHDANHPSDAEIEYGHKVGNSPAPRVADKEEIIPRVSDDQMDLFTGRTVSEHADDDSGPLAKYHQSQLGM